MSGGHWSGGDAHGGMPGAPQAPQAVFERDNFAKAASYPSINWK